MFKFYEFFKDMNLALNIKERISVPQPPPRVPPRKVTSEGEPLEKRSTLEGRLRNQSRPQKQSILFVKFTNWT